MPEHVSEHRTQVYLPDALYRRVVSYARTRGLSMAEVIRQSLSHLVEKHDRGTDPLLGIVGAAGTVGVTDGSAEHDRYVYGPKVKVRGRKTGAR